MTKTSFQVAHISCGTSNMVCPKCVNLFANITLLKCAVTLYVTSQHCMCIGHMTFYYKKAADTLQVDGLGTSYLLFYDKQGHQGLGQDTVYAIWAHMEEAFSGWILHSTHFTISLLPLVEVWQ